MVFLNASDQSNLEPAADAALSASPPPQRAVARARPKRPRKPSIASLRAQREAFEFAVTHLPYLLRDLDDAPSSTSTANSTDGEESDLISVGDHDAQRVCAFLKRTIVLSRQAQEEIAKRTEYLRLLKRHYEGTANLRKLMRGVELDYWFWMCERWRELARKYYKPLSATQCYATMQETIRAIENYKLPDGMKQNDAFGWCDSVRLDDDQSYVRFMTRKTLENADLEQVVDQTWSLNRDGDAYKGSHLGNNSELFHQTLQQLSPDVMIVQRVEKYPELVQLTYSLSLIFRVQTESGYMIATRCIESSRLQSLMKADGLSLCRSFFWETFDAVSRSDGGESNAIQFTAAGSVGSDDPTYTKRWHNELLIALVRYEIQVMDTPILSLESIADDAGDTTSAVHGS